MESHPQMLPAAIATLCFVVGAVFYVYVALHPGVKFRGWKGQMMGAFFGFACAISVVFIWKFCTATRYPTRMDIYVLAVSVQNLATFGAACLTNIAGAFKERKAKSSLDPEAR
jgi:hypothetical protein